MQSIPLTTKTPIPHWKDAALQKAEIITDTWEVVKAYAGRAAEWVLFLCMIVNIVEMLPGVSLPATMTNTVLGIQVVMLDIGGMSLSTMAAYIRALGDAEAAKKAGITSKFLIGLMIVTLLMVSIGLLFPMVKPYTDMAEKGLILIRVVMTVMYSHVIHSLRSSHRQVPVPPAPQLAVPTLPEMETLIRTILVPMLEQYRTEMGSQIAGQGQVSATPYQQLAAVMQDSSRVEEIKQSSQVLPLSQMRDRRRLRQLPAPASPKGNTRSADRETRLVTAYRELLREGIRVTGKTLSGRARCNRAVALAWLKQYGSSGEKGEIEVVSMEKPA
jgi:hypothetical protein